MFTVRDGRLAVLHRFLDFETLTAQMSLSETMDEEVVPVLRVEDADRAVSWYQRLGFHKQWEHQFEPGFPWFVCVSRGRVKLYLSEHTGDAVPNTLIHLNVADIDVVAREFEMAVDEEGLARR